MTLQNMFDDPKFSHPIVRKYSMAILEGFTLLPSDRFMEFMVREGVGMGEEHPDIGFALACIAWVMSEGDSLPNDEFLTYVFGGCAKDYATAREFLSCYFGYELSREFHQGDYCWRVVIRGESLP